MSRTLISDDQSYPGLETSSLSLLQLLHNSLVFASIIPHLPIASLLHLAAASKAFRSLVFAAPASVRHLDLSHLKTARHSPHLDDGLTEDSFYSAPLRHVFSALRRNDLLRHVQILVLDGLPVTSDFCCDIINHASYSVRILSIRHVTHLNQAKLRGALQYACRKSRPDESPRLHSLYVFGAKDAVSSSAEPSRRQLHDQRPTSAPPPSSFSGEALLQPVRQKTVSPSCSLLEEGDAWWSRKGRLIARPISDEWAGCLVACDGLIAFDALLCQGPRHANSPAFGRPSMPCANHPAVATFALSPCHGCGQAPEGLIYPDSRPPVRLPLLSPSPTLSSSLRAATRPRPPYTPFVARCSDCLANRYCSACHCWWCESCYQIPSQSAPAEIGHLDESSARNIDAKVRDSLCRRCAADNQDTKLDGGT